ncbi:hypothetical protein [Janthinobacterium sp.]|uniref:hypothetical protein n=1 Tax=Janthinobacterium sp. TaxID=1871054 RepID=UPI0025C08652|nr:hypothetical protein [Janthinobacterium sp.]NBV19947.1 hypothetical protein [Janthinobacterium sp.]
MPVTRYTNGAVTVTLDDGIDQFVRSMLSAAETESLAVLEAEAEAIAAQARREWYGPDGVTRRTGKSGDIVAVSTFDTVAGEVRVTVGSTDTRTERGKPVAALVHRPTATSKIIRPAKQADFDAGRAQHSPPGQKLKNHGIVVESNPKASDGKQLMVEFVRRPVTRRLRALIPKLGQAIALKAGGARG